MIFETLLYHLTLLHLNLP